MVAEKSTLAALVTPQELKLLEAITGAIVDSAAPLTLHRCSWIAYVRRQSRSYPPTELRDLIFLGQPLDDNSFSPGALSAKCFLMLTSLAGMTAVEPQISIDKAIRLLSDSTRQHLRPESSQEPLINRTRSLVFCCISWITMLYSTSFQPDFHNLHLDHIQCASIVHSQPTLNSENPLCELLQDFGPLLPVRDDQVLGNVSDPVFSADSLYVSLLNAATLRQLGGIQIEWIDNISSHLQFDAELRKLLIFHFPSFWEVHRYNSLVFTK